jgi:citrate lyase subunit beta/citryl-CoA lyase
MHVAGRPEFIRKSLELQQELEVPFDVMCDFEDGSPVGDEVAHRSEIIDLLKSELKTGNRVGVRIHEHRSEHWRAEVDQLFDSIASALRFICVPKVTKPEELQEVIDYSQAAAHAAGRNSIPIHVVIETHEALRWVWEIATMEHVQSLDFGIMDFVSAHRGAIPVNCMRSPGQFSHPLIVRAKTEISAAALANGVVPTHNVTVDFRNTEQVRRDALQARTNFGFLRMWSVHPNHIAPIVDAMKPKETEINRAEEILFLAEDGDWGPLAYQGEMHDRSSFRYYWQILSRAQANGCTISEEAASRFFAGIGAA